MKFISLIFANELKTLSFIFKSILNEFFLELGEEKNRKNFSNFFVFDLGLIILCLLQRLVVVGLFL
jgi:hypothetical protein